MNYLMQINAFKKRRRLYPISCGSICLYYVLLEYANSLGFPKEFTVANQVIAGLCSMSVPKLQRTRKELIDKNYIRYKYGKKGSSGVYGIIPYNFDDRKIIEYDTEQHIEYHNEQHYEHNTDSIVNTLYKNKRKERLNKRELMIQESSWHDYDIDALEKAALKRSLEN